MLQQREILNYKIYQMYNKRCEKASAMDFDDLLLKTYQLLESNGQLQIVQGSNSATLIDQTVSSFNATVGLEFV